MIKQITLHHNFITLASCIIGYMLWAFIAQYQTVTMNKNVPICFYQVNDQHKVLAPESVSVTVSGKRKNLHRYNPEQSALHINAATLKEGTHHITLSQENLFLPDSIKLVQLIPSHIELEIIKQ